MSQKVSMADIARQLNISRATVSYVLNERESELISEATRTRVLDTARQLGYRRNRAAQALAGQQSYLVELCVYGFYPAFYARVLHEFERIIASTPYQLHIVNPNSWKSKDWENNDGGWPIDGIIIFDAFLPDAAMMNLQERGVPIVGAGIFPNTGWDYVQVDLSAALKDALRFLTAKSRRVAYLSDRPENRESFDPRFPTYKKAMEAANLPLELIVAPDRGGLETRSQTRSLVRDYIAQNGCPDAILCFNDERAIATMAALRDLKLRVPDDVLIIGCDGIEETAYHSPSISTIQYPLEETTRLCWRFLQQRIQQPDISLQSAILPAQFVARESSHR